MSSQLSGELGTDRHEPRLEEFGITDRDHALDDIQIAKR
jgi:hypothetical protein